MLSQKNSAAFVGCCLLVAAVARCRLAGLIQTRVKPRERSRAHRKLKAIVIVIFNPYFIPYFVPFRRGPRLFFHYPVPA